MRRHLDGASDLELVVFAVHGDEARDAFEAAVDEERPPSGGLT